MFNSTATFLVRLWPQSAPSKRDSMGNSIRKLQFFSLTMS